MQVQRLSSDFEIISIRGWDEFTGVEFNVHPGGEEAFAVAGHDLYFEVTVRNNTDKWQLVYLDFTIGGMWMGTIAVYPRPHDVEVAKLSPRIDYACGYWTVKLYKDTTVYQTISFYAFKIWGGNHHLLGDVNFDGFVNMEDLDLVKAQLGRTSGDVWGTGSDQYDPNRDLDMDGVISGRDAYVVRKLLGRWTEWDCLTHPNPSMINNGEGWTITTSDMTPGETWGEFAKISLTTTFYTNKRGFKHDVEVYASYFGGSGYTEVDFTPNAHFAHNPDDWNKVLPGDIPLSQLADYKFIVEGQAHDWQHYMADLYIPGDGYIGPSMYSYLGWSFGGWVILKEPYKIYGVTITGLPEPFAPNNILEMKFWIKQHKDGQSLMPGGDEWHRIFYRKGLKFNMRRGWFIVGYVLGDPKVGETVQVELSGEKILQLLKTLEGKDKIYQKNPLFPHNYEIFMWTDFYIKELNLEGAFFRPVYFQLDAGVDNYVSSPNIAEKIITSASFYGAYLYHKKKGVIWGTAFSPTANVRIIST